MAIKAKTAADHSAGIGAGPEQLVDLMAEVRYAINFGGMNEAFNGFLDRLATYVVLLFAPSTGLATLAMYGKFGQHDLFWITVILGVLTAFAYAAKKVFRFKKRKAEFRTAKNAFITLESIGWNLSEAALRKKVASALKMAPTGGFWARRLAYNRTCEELGYPDWCVNISKFERLFWSAIAWL